MRYITVILFSVWLIGAEPHSRSIIYQPQRDDFKTFKLEKRFQSLQQLGFQELIIQWTSYGEYNFLEKHPYWIATLLDLAEKHHIELIFGLYADPDYFDQIKKDKELQSYLTKLTQKHTKRAIDLAILIHNSPMFKGWYICDEIDDMNWNTKNRQSYLKKYLKTLNQTLLEITPNKKIMISSYFASSIEINTYAQMLINTIPENWYLLVQSGVGAKLVSIDQSKAYYDLFTDQYKGNWKFIIELFSIEDKTLKPNFTLYRKQIAYIDVEKSTLFSWRYFFDKKFQSKYNLE